MSLRRVHKASLLYGVASVTRPHPTPSVGRNQVLISPHQLGRGPDRFWTQATTVKAHSPGTPMSLSDEAGGSGQWNMAGVEVRFDDDRSARAGRARPPGRTRHG